MEAIEESIGIKGGSKSPGGGKKKKWAKASNSCYYVPCVTTLFIFELYFLLMIRMIDLNLWSEIFPRKPSDFSWQRLFCCKLFVVIFVNISKQWKLRIKELFKTFIYQTKMLTLNINEITNCRNIFQKCLCRIVKSPTNSPRNILI